MLTGSLEERNALVESHIPMVRPIALAVFRYLPKTQYELEDLISFGYLGLIRAADRYTPERFAGAPFWAFARPYVHGAIVDSLRHKAFEEFQYSPNESTVAPELEEAIDRGRLERRVCGALSMLSPAEARVMRMRYAGGLPFHAIARRLKRCDDGIYRIHGRALRKLRANWAWSMNRGDYGKSAPTNQRLPRTVTRGNRLR